MSLRNVEVDLPLVKMTVCLLGDDMHVHQGIPLCILDEIVRDVLA